MWSTFALSGVPLTEACQPCVSPRPGRHADCLGETFLEALEAVAQLKGVARAGLDCGSMKKLCHYQPTLMARYYSLHPLSEAQLAACSVIVGDEPRHGRPE